MKKYKIFARGQNFLFDVNGKPERLGFYTTRFVEAADEKAAEENAISILRDDPTLKQCTLNEKTDAPMLFVEEITEVDSFNGLNVPGAGFSFYPETYEG